VYSTKAKYFIVIFKETFLNFTPDIFDQALSLFNNSVCDVPRKQKFQKTRTGVVLNALYRVFTRHWRSENSLFTAQISPANIV